MHEMPDLPRPGKESLVVNQINAVFMLSTVIDKI